MQQFNRFNIINKSAMSLQSKNKNVRVLSARVVQAPTERVRPLSGVPNQTYTRRQMIINSYNSQGSDGNRAQSARQNTINIISHNFEGDRYARKISGKQTKQKEQMASQIIGLKQTINRLVQQLSHQKGKVENIRKKNMKYSKILTMEFEDEKQWGSNAVNNHLVTGIKNMYDTLKQKYQAKCQQLESIIKKETVTNDMENEQYTKALQGQIKNLKKKIEKMNEINLSSVFTSQTQRYANEYVISDLQTEKVTLTQKNKQLEKRYKQTLKNCKELELKIQIDKKLIDEKDNNLHALQRKNKELCKQNTKIKEVNIFLDRQLSQIKDQYQKQVQSHRSTVILLQERCKREIQAINKSKDNKIQSLSDDNSYLHKMIQDLRSTNLELNKSNQELKEQNLKYSTRSYDQHSDNRESKKDKNAASKNQSRKWNQPANVPFQNGKRIPQKADKKYHQDALKSRKIELMQVLQLAQLIRLKLIAQEYCIEDVKKLFDSSSSRSTKQVEWQREYITMGEVKEIFKAAPFNLQQQDVLTISRYLIEDVQQDYVYCDDLNENHRDVVKSIIKTLIQEYPIYTDGSPQYYELNQELDRYRKNLKSALKTLAKQGVVSKAKLLEVMKSIGMEVQPHIIELILSKLALKSNSLNYLNYSVVF